MMREQLTQEAFNKLLETTIPNKERCIFPYCRKNPITTIRIKEQEYGVCDEHWDLLSESNVEWGETPKIEDNL